MTQFLDWLEPYMDQRMVPLQTDAKPRQGVGKPEAAKYSPDQPRDDHGRWTADGSTGSSDVTGGFAESRDMHKNPDGSYTAERQALHDRILNSILWNGVATDKPTVTMLGGGPATGKSTLIARGFLPVPSSTVRIDPDGIKTKLPEYNQMLAAGGADQQHASTFVHEESSELSKVAMRTALDNKYDLLYDTTGDNSLSNLEGKIASWRAAGATEVNGIYATCDTNVALQRSEDRFQMTGRYVPTDYLVATHQSVSNVVPAAINDKAWDNFSLYDTNGSEPLLVASYQNKGDLQIHDQAAWDKFLAKGAG